MRWSQSLIPTLRQVPAEATVPSHQLMLRAGLIHQVAAGAYSYLPLGWRCILKIIAIVRAEMDAAGAYSYLPLGWRVLKKVMTIIRDQMDAAGAVEVFLPSLQPIEWWAPGTGSGRLVDYGDNLFRVTDRHGRQQALGPTHEEVITKLFDAFVSSYRQLPINLYQIQTKFRDEFRPRFGVLRSREFQMKDAYSFHLTLEGGEASGSLDETYQKMYDAYRRIFDRCNIPYEVVEAESGPIGGSASHEFMVPSPTGEDIILSNGAGYAANVEKCQIGPRPGNLQGQPTGELDRVHTPGCATISDVCDFMKVRPWHMLKTLVYKAGERWVIGVVRGDHDLNEGKLRDATGAPTLELADDAEARAAGFVIGFVGPHVAVGRADVNVYVDPDVAQDQFWATGANEVDHHVKHFNWKRDVLDHVDASGITVADIRNAVDGDPAPEDRGGRTLRQSKGIEIGHVFKLGPKYTQALGVTVLDENQNQVTPLMGCYGIGVNRVIAAAIESAGGHDDSGIIFPLGIAPYEVVITPVKYEGRVAEQANRIYGSLKEAGVDVLLDDRAERAGVKFKDADKGLANDEIEFKPRTADKAEMVQVDQAVQRAAEFAGRS
jgi:prolyl-tRNA synthetase